MPHTAPGAWHRIREYFLFTKWQRRAVIICFLIITACIVLEAGWPYWFAKSPTPADQLVLEEVKELVALEAAADSQYAATTASENWRAPKSGKQKESTFSTARLFAFDPNTASEEELRKLGLQAKTAKTILNYRSKGGRFRKPEDILKIYSLPKEQAKALLPYVQITEPPTASYTNTLPPAPRPERPYSPKTININEADTTAWIALPGIGSKLAYRIVNFRDKLGGFYSIDQVGETYALPDSTFQKIRSRLVLNNPASLRTININTCTADMLKAHPYVKWNVANAIVNYRQQHGPFQSVDDLKKIMLIDEAWFNKMRPYLSIQ